MDPPFKRSTLNRSSRRPANLQTQGNGGGSCNRSDYDNTGSAGLGVSSISPAWSASLFSKVWVRVEAAISVVTHALINSRRQKKGLRCDSAPRWACGSGGRSSGLDACLRENIQNAWMTRSSCPTSTHIPAGSALWSGVTGWGGGVPPERYVGQKRRETRTFESLNSWETLEQDRPPPPRPPIPPWWP